MSIPPYTVKPEVFALDPEERCTITVVFAPQTTGVHDREFVLMCDNLQTRTFQVTGLGTEVKVDLVKVRTAVDALPPPSGPHCLPPSPALFPPWH